MPVLPSVNFQNQKFLSSNAPSTSSCLCLTPFCLDDGDFVLITVSANPFFFKKNLLFYFDIQHVWKKLTSSTSRHQTNTEFYKWNLPAPRSPFSKCPPHLLSFPLGRILMPGLVFVFPLNIVSVKLCSVYLSLSLSLCLAPSAQGPFMRRVHVLCALWFSIPWYKLTPISLLHSSVDGRVSCGHRE